MAPLAPREHAREGITRRGDLDAHAVTRLRGLGGVESSRALGQTGGRSEDFLVMTLAIRERVFHAVQVECGIDDRHRPVGDAFLTPRVLRDTSSAVVVHVDDDVPLGVQVIAGDRF